MSEQAASCVLIHIADPYCRCYVQVTRERIRQIEGAALLKLRNRQQLNGSRLLDYKSGSLVERQLAARTSSGTKKT